MKTECLLLMLAAVCAGCANGPKLVRTPPGTSVEVALAKKAELVRLPGPSPEAVAARKKVPAVEPGLPEPDKSDLVTDAFSRAQFCMKTGADAEAIAAFREVVKLDPSFGDAWQNLAALYERQGDEQSAMEAFRNSKKLAKH